MNDGMNTYSDALVSKFRDEVMARDYPPGKLYQQWDDLEETAKMIWRKDFAKRVHKLSIPPAPLPEHAFILQQIDQLLKRLGEITKP